MLVKGEEDAEEEEWVSEDEGETDSAFSDEDEDASEDAFDEEEEEEKRGEDKPWEISEDNEAEDDDVPPPLLLLLLLTLTLLPLVVVDGLILRGKKDGRCKWVVWDMESSLDVEADSSESSASSSLLDSDAPLADSGAEELV